MFKFINFGQGLYPDVGKRIVILFEDAYGEKCMLVSVYNGNILNSFPKPLGWAYLDVFLDYSRYALKYNGWDLEKDHLKNLELTPKPGVE
jgi:hypothetical protein